jgi:hypothetical protein
MAASEIAGGDFSGFRGWLERGGVPQPRRLITDIRYLRNNYASDLETLEVDQLWRVHDEVIPPDQSDKSRHNIRSALKRYIEYRLEGAAGSASSPSASKRRSSGPPPCIGIFEAERPDSQTTLYMMQLVGTGLSRRRVGPDAIVKVGRSNDVQRRVKQLNYGLLPIADIAWQVVVAKAYPTAMLAHQAEQALLDQLEDQGRIISHEFASLPDSNFVQLIAMLKS